jgi:hypothetical protein
MDFGPCACYIELDFGVALSTALCCTVKSNSNIKHAAAKVFELYSRFNVSSVGLLWRTLE